MKPSTVGAVELLAIHRELAGAPSSVTMQVTDRCNYECVHCYQEHDAKPDELTTDEIRGILDQLADAGVLYVVFMGGEFFMRRDADELLQAAHDRGFAIRIKTTGHHIHDRRADYLASIRPLEVDLSVYGAHADVHEIVTRHPGSWARTVAAARRLIARKVAVTLRVPLMEVNVGEVGALQALADELGARISFDPKITPREDAVLEPVTLRMTAATLEAFYAGAMRAELEATWEGYDGCSQTRRGGVINALDASPCEAGRVVGIDPQGQVWPCNVLAVPAGDLRKQTFAEIFGGSTFAEIRGLTWASLSECNVCEVRTYCQRCHAMALVEHGDLRGPSLEACRHAVATRDALRARGLVPETDTALPPTWSRIDPDGQHHRVGAGQRRVASLRVLT